MYTRPRWSGRPPSTKPHWPAQMRPAATLKVRAMQLTPAQRLLPAAPKPTYGPPLVPFLVPHDTHLDATRGARA